MKRFCCLTGMLCGLALPAMAADYYAAGRYTTASDGEGEVLVNGDNLRTVDGGYKATDVAVVNAAGAGVVVYDVQFDCPAKTWRVTAQYDYYIARTMAPAPRVPRELPPFAPVHDGTPIVGAMNLVCGWPGSNAGAAKVTATDPISLSQAVSPTLQPAPPAAPAARDER